MNTSHIYQEVTNRILAEMEKGIIPWQKPWTCSGGAVSHISGRPYSLLNQILIGMGGQDEEQTYGEYLTFNQAKAEGVTVIEKDFFNVTSIHVSHIDMIVMNPPFSNQAVAKVRGWELPANVKVKKGYKK